MYAYQPRRKQDESIEQAINEIVKKHLSWGFWKIYHRLRKNALIINHKRLWRIYCHLRLNLLRKKKKRLPECIKQPLAIPMMANQV